MEASHVCLMSEDINYVRQIAKKFNIPGKIDRPLARELFIILIIIWKMKLIVSIILL